MTGPALRAYRRPGWPARLLRLLAAGAPRRMDWVLLGAVTGLCVLGTLLVWSATGGPGGAEDGPGQDGPSYVQRHIVHLAVAAVVCLGVAAVDYRMQRAYAPVVYGATVVGLVLVLTPLGAVINGSRGWLVVGGFQAQPSELAKIGLVMVAAMLLGEPRDGETAPTSRDVLISLLALALPTVLVLTQPDLGTALVLCASYLGMLALSGAPPWWIVGMGVTGVGAAAAVWWFDLLQPYQVARVATLIDPGADPQGTGYNTNQALIAIGSGGLRGTGLFHGAQTSGDFVPEQHTDFIFTVAGEELGFAGGALVIALFAVVLWRVLGIAADSRTPYARLVCVGVAAWLGFQGAVNIAMTLGIAPVTGLPLPFVSYGGTAAIANLAAIGLVLGVHARERGFE